MTTATKTRKRKAAGITLPADALKQSLSDISKAVPSRSPKPVLQNALLANGRLLGTDLEVQVSTPIDWDGEPLLLPFARLTAILREARSDEVTLTVDGSACIVTAGRGMWRLPVQDAAEFPSWEPEGLRLVGRVPADQFCRSAKGVVYATDNESSRYALGAVCIEYDRTDGKLSLIATDGRRLSLSIMSLCENQDPDDSQTLVPAHAMAIISDIAGRHGNDEVELNKTGSELVATIRRQQDPPAIGDVTVTARLLEGRFPRWRDVFPAGVFDTTPAIVDRESLLQATRAAAIVVSEQSKGVDFTFGETGLHLHGQSSEYGESAVSIDLERGGPDCTVKLDPRFVGDWLAGLADGEPTIEVRATDFASAVVLRSGDFRGVIMPLAKD